MQLKNNGWYTADKGKHFILTEKGKKECASFKHKAVGEPVDEYDTEAVNWSIEKGYEIEVNIPDWIVKEGYEVVYDHRGYTLHAGNSIVFPEKDLAENYMEHYKRHPWIEEELYIRETTFEGRALKPCREYNGKQVYNFSWYYGTDALKIGDYVEEEIVDDLINSLPPACMRSDCCQCGEPADHKADKNGNYKATYATFKRIAENTWEYCGECFRGENIAA